MKRQIDNPSPGAVTGGNQSLALTREVNLDTLSSDSSAEEIRDAGRSLQSLIVWGKKLKWLRVSEFGKWVRLLYFSALNHFYLTAVTGVGTSPALATYARQAMFCLWVCQVVFPGYFHFAGPL